MYIKTPDATMFLDKGNPIAHVTTLHRPIPLCQMQVKDRQVPQEWRMLVLKMLSTCIDPYLIRQRKSNPGAPSNCIITRSQTRSRILQGNW